MDELAELHDNRHWRMAVWALRVGFAGLAIALGGLITVALGGTPWVLATGVVVWLASVAVMVTGFLWSRHELPGPRPGFWPIRSLLLRDTFHVRPGARRS